MSEKIKNIVSILSALATASFTFGISGIALDGAADIQLASQVNRFANSHLELHSSQRGGDDFITNDASVDVDIPADTQIFVAEGSTFEDYCVLGKSPSNPTGIVLSSAEFIGSVEASSCDDDKTMELVAGPESIEESIISPVSTGLVVFSGLSGIGALGLFTSSSTRRKKMAYEAVGEPEYDDIPLPVQPTANREQLRDHMEKIVMEWSSYEMDPVKILDYPMISNMGFAPTSNFHLAMLRAKNGFRDNVDIAALRTLVTDMEHAYRVMVSEAERMKWNQFSTAEQNHLRTAQRLLNIAMDSASSPNERNMAYKRLLKEVEGIITFAPATILEIESNLYLHIESSRKYFSNR